MSFKPNESQFERTTTERLKRLKEDELPLRVFRQRGFGEGFQVGDAAANREVELSRIDDRGEWLTYSLATHGLGNQVFVL